ncbi:MAG: phenylalanine--tRNA ligase subunit beta, partial [Cyclobacteriaceae bacterium]
DEREPNKIRRTVSQMLTGSGYQEILNNSLTNPSYVDNTNGLDPEQNIHILNKLSEELGILRQSLIFGGLESIAHNINRRYPNLKFFEFGKCYFDQSKKYIEKQQLALFITGKTSEENWLKTVESASFYDLSSEVRKILGKFNFDVTESRPTDKEYYNYGLDILHNNNLICSLGKLSENTTSQCGVKQEVFYAEFNWEYLISKYQISIEYKPIPKFPEVKRDLSLILDKSVTFEEVRKLALQTERKLLKRLDVFSVYEGEKIGTEKKSYAISFILQDLSKTLTDKQIDKTMNQLIRAFEEKIGAIIRK